MSLLRLAVLLFVIALFFPSTPEEKRQAYEAISTAVEQVRTFCVRNAALCENSQIVASAIYDRVRIGAEILYEAAAGGTEPGAASPRVQPVPARYDHQRRTRVNERRSDQKRSSDTLRTEDRAPSWRGPDTS